jgi:Zn-finger nucleic acid-binding protein
MDFISETEGQQILVELKYCERCGGLWLRPQGTDGVYCASCRELFAAMPDPGEAPAPKPRHRRPKARAQKQGAEVQRKDLMNAVRIDCLQGVAAIEVRA